MTYRPIVFANLMRKINVDHSTGCWNWKFYRTDDGYGRLSYKGKLRLAHRLSKYLYGEISWKTFKDSNVVAMHLCDNPPCIRPDHVRMGTQRENIKDRVSKGRCTRGERKWSAKVTESQVREIRNMRTAGIDFPIIAQKFKISPVTVKQIVYRRKWKHVT